MRFLPFAMMLLSFAVLATAQTAMTLTIPGFPDGGQIPVKFSQAAPGAAPGEGTSPAMSWANAPAGTQSFFLHMHDLDLARNKTTDDQAHWVFWNIPATAKGLPEGVPKGSQLPDGSYQICATGAGVPGSGGRGERSTAPLRVRTVRAGHQAGREALGGCVRDSDERDESDPGPHSREGRIRRTVPPAAVIAI